MDRASPDRGLRRVYLVDDDEAVRAALALLLRTLEIDVEAFADPALFLDTLPGRAPGCLVLDVRMPRLSGLKLQERLAAAGCVWPVVVISGHGDIETCRRAFRGGAVDFLSKPVDEEDLIDAVERGFSELETARIAAAERAESRALLDALTPREREVLDLVTRGFSTREIASALGVSPRTVETHRAHLAAKLGTGSVAELTRLVDAANGAVAP